MGPFQTSVSRRLTHAGCTLTGNYILVRRLWCDWHPDVFLRVLARSARFSIRLWGVPWSTALPLGVSFQATRYQGTSFPRPDSFYSDLTALLCFIFTSISLPRLPFNQMLTPSGRFQPDKKICFSMSDFHPGSVSRRFSPLHTPLLLFRCETDTECSSGIPLGA